MSLLSQNEMHTHTKLSEKVLSIIQQDSIELQIYHQFHTTP